MSKSKNIVQGDIQSQGHVIVGDNNRISVVHPSEPTVNELFSNAKLYLSNNDFKNAQETLNKLILKTPNDADPYFYLALSLIAGRRPKILGFKEAEEAVRNIDVAISKDSAKAHFYYLKAIILYDFYCLNGFSVDIEEINELLVIAANVVNDKSMIKEVMHFTPNIDKEIANCIPWD